MNFSEIIGQEDAKNLLKHAIMNDATSHAYIFSGEKGSGKTMLAEAFASMLLCENPVDDSCGQCRSCRQAMTRNNPDIIYVMPEDEKSSLGVDVIREKINNNIVLKPYSSKYKVYIVKEAEKMNQQAQNALLKTIEEPPAYAVIILLTTNHNAFLQTILSRCVTIQMKPVSSERIISYLQQNYQVVDYQSQMVAAFAQGNMGRAIELSQSDDFNATKATVLSVLKKADKMDEYDVSEAVKVLTEHKDKLEEELDLITLWYRDVLLYKASASEKYLIFKEDMYNIKEMAKGYSYHGLDNVFASIRDTRSRIKSNVNLDLTVMLLILTIKENIE